MEHGSKLIYKGFIKEDIHGEYYDAIYIGEYDEPIAEILQCEIKGKFVSVRYWISDIERTKQELTEDFIKTISGSAEVKYKSRYSDITGYLLTDEDLVIGGHDLMNELRSNLGKFIYLEIDVEKPLVKTSGH